MTTTLLVLFTIVGIAIGSFLNVCIDRLPRNKSLLSPPSHCDACGRRLAALDLVPLLSYLWLRGRCRYCRARIPLRVPLVELLTGALFFLAFWYYGLSARFGVTALWCCVFLVIIFIDWEHKLILNKVTYPMAALALIILAVESGTAVSLVPSGFAFLPLDKPIILSGVIGGAVGLGFFLLVFLINPRGMGLGDVKLACLIGLMTGWPIVIEALLIGIIIGGLIAIGIMIYRMKHVWHDSIQLFKQKRYKNGFQLLFVSRKKVSVGSFLAIGPLVTLFWGVDIFHWYQNLFGFHIIP
jgi:leader peptidase (prepilin peptidase)/N-methyltransferase